MNIELNRIKIKDLVAGYFDNSNGGVRGYNGLLDIRPAYQREFVYKDEKRNKVIESVMKGFPLNVMYWVDNGNGQYEVLDGQQRAISICQYYIGMFGINNIAYHNLPSNKKEQFNEYELMVYFCSGTPSEKLDWFETINIAGERLTKQELRNAVFTGPWLSSAKTYFSKNNCVAHQLGGKYLDGYANRQEYLETVLKWISHRDYGRIDIEQYMSSHQLDANADALWHYFEEVINWVKGVFMTYRKEMEGINWGILYNLYKTKILNPAVVDADIKKLYSDEDVSERKGIFEYILSGKESCLSIRKFTDTTKSIAFNNQLFGTTGKATCPKCDASKLYDLNQMEADHIIPWSKGGKTVVDNCQMLCKYHNGVKSNN